MNTHTGAIYRLLRRAGLNTGATEARSKGNNGLKVGRLSRTKKSIKSLRAVKRHENRRSLGKLFREMKAKRERAGLRGKSKNRRKQIPTEAGEEICCLCSLQS